MDGRIYGIIRFRHGGSCIRVATGRKPNIEGLGLDKIGVIFNDKGIEVDERMRTSQKHICAAGDVNGSYLFTHVAGYEGGIVVSNAIFHLPRKANYAFSLWCTYTDPELASIGLNETAAKKAGYDCPLWTEEFRTNDRSFAEGEETGKIKMILNGKSRSPSGYRFSDHMLANLWENG